MEEYSDLAIASRAKLEPMPTIAARAHIPERFVIPYGRNKLKLDLALLKEAAPKKAKLILVTAINPTAAGEGKTTMTIGLADALRQTGREAVIAMREPSLGPVFGIKGGACGGGYAQVAPMDEINLHFTGDIHAVGAANNLLAAMLDNHIQKGNALGIDPATITWKRCLDMNDRQLRFLVDGLGGKANGCPREDGFDITVASEVMAILCLSESLADLKQRLGSIVVGYSFEGQPIRCRDLRADGAMAALLKEAIQPNLVQSLEGTPAFIHGGPFGNIAHGCNSVLATRMALRSADYVVTEAGFGADLGAEKFLDIKCRASGLSPDAVVLVATVRALKLHGGAEKAQLNEENTEALRRGFPNLLRHARNLREVYGLPCVVCINSFPSDTGKEIALLRSLCREHGLEAELSTAWRDGGRGSLALAKRAASLCESGKDFHFSYGEGDSLLEKLRAVVCRVYGGAGVKLLPAAEKQLKQLEALGFGSLPVCIAKTQYSFSDDPSLLGAPEGFTVTVRQLRVSAGAGFVVALAGDIMTMPGLPSRPAAERIDIDEEGNITGLF